MDIKQVLINIASTTLSRSSATTELVIGTTLVGSSPSITGSTGGTVVVAPTIINTATYTYDSSDEILQVIYSTTGDCVIGINSVDITDTLRFDVKDAAGNASEYNIKIYCISGELIDGATEYYINKDYDSISFYSDGINIYIK